MRTQEEIIKRIGVLTATIGNLQEELYTLALENKPRKNIWQHHMIDKKTMRLYSELRVLEWVLEDERGTVVNVEKMMGGKQ